MIGLPFSPLGIAIRRREQGHGSVATLSGDQDGWRNRKFPRQDDPSARTPTGCCRRHVKSTLPLRYSPPRKLPHQSPVCRSLFRMDVDDGTTYVAGISPAKHFININILDNVGPEKLESDVLVFRIFGRNRKPFSRVALYLSPKPLTKTFFTPSCKDTPDTLATAAWASPIPLRESSCAPTDWWPPKLAADPSLGYSRFSG